MTAKNQSRVTIDIPEDAHRRLKALAALRGETMRTIVLGWIEDNVYSSHAPNEETLKAFKETEDDVNLVHCKDLNDLAKKLGI